jgi:hypothetical protein
MGIAAPYNLLTDNVLNMFIHSTSSIILSYLERGSFVSSKHSDIFDGQGNQMRFPHYWPVTSVMNVQVDNFVVPPAGIVNPTNTNVNLQGGWRLEYWDGLPPGEHQAVELDGYAFRRGHLNCRIDYVAGYLNQETILIDGTGTTQTLQQGYGLWLADSGVALLSDGTPLQLVPPPTPPAVLSTGQYALDSTVPGGYIFSPADSGVPVIVSYSFCPYAVEQACWEFVAVSYNRRQHPGQRSRSLAAQESVTYDPQGIPSYILDALQPFRSVLPE